MSIIIQELMSFSIPGFNWQVQIFISFYIVKCVIWNGRECAWPEQIPISAGGKYRKRDRYRKVVLSVITCRRFYPLRNTGWKCESEVRQVMPWSSVFQLHVPESRMLQRKRFWNEFSFLKIHYQVWLTSHVLLPQ